MKTSEFVQNSNEVSAIQKNSSDFKLSAGSILNNTAKQFNAVVKTLSVGNIGTLKVARQLNILNDNFSKQLSLLKNITTMAKMPVQAVKPLQQRDLRFKEDVNKELRADVNSLDKTVQSMYKLQKEEKKSGGLLAWIGKAMALGGLVGWLITGKNEFLIDTLKGFKYITKSILFPFKIAKLAYTGLKSFIGVGSDVVKAGKSLFSLKITDISKIAKPIKSAFTQFKTVFSTIAEGIKVLGFKETFNLVSDQYKFLKPIKSAFTGIKTMFSSVKGFVGGIKGIFSGFSHMVGGAVKTVGSGFKAAGKAGLMKIPMLGALMGITFGIMRFKKGDFVGGLLELASGFSPFLNVIPGLGLAVGLAIDSYLMFRDFKMSDAEKKGQSKSFKKYGMEALKAMPLIGTFLRMSEGFKLWKSGDKKKALKEFALGLAKTIPGVGVLASLTDSLFNYFGEKGSTVDENASNIDIGGDSLSASLGISEGGKPTNNNAETESDAPTVSFGFDKKNGKYQGVNLGLHPNFEGLNPIVKSNFVAMANEYFKLTGKNIQVNSAQRSGNKQSMHYPGLAIDIQSKDANALEGLGLMQKYRFHRPLLNWKNNDPSNPNAFNETWHIEPYAGGQYGQRNTNNLSYRQQNLRDNPNPLIIETGGDSLGSSKRIPNTKSTEEKKELELSNETIQKLAIAIAENNKNKINVSNRTVISTTDGRSNF